ncbi:MAG: ribbon-helix-helix protein, CopG family [Acidobacteriota bacterium]|jgi:L-serine deaminase|nr:ribbon-helix-helix protein, CopG family [Acidobacteriota bacterium]
MVRTQIQLTREQAEAIKREAAERGASMAEIIRLCIDAHLRDVHRPSEEELRRRAASIVGMIKDGPSDMSRRHDDYLAEAYEA